MRNFRNCLLFRGLLWKWWLLIFRKFLMIFFFAHCYFLLNQSVLGQNLVLEEKIIFNSIGSDNVVHIARDGIGNQYLYLFDNFKEYVNVDGRIFEKRERGLVFSQGERLILPSDEEFVSGYQGKFGAFDDGQFYLFTVKTGWVTSKQDIVVKEVRRYKVKNAQLHLDKKIALPHEEFNISRADNLLIINDFSEWGGSYFEFYDLDFERLNKYQPFSDSFGLAHLFLSKNAIVAVSSKNEMAKIAWLSKQSGKPLFEKELSNIYPLSIKKISANEEYLCLYLYAHLPVRSKTVFEVRVYNKQGDFIWKEELAEPVRDFYQINNSAFLYVKTKNKLHIYDIKNGNQLQNFSWADIHNQHPCSHSITPKNIYHKTFSLLENNYLGLLLADLKSNYQENNALFIWDNQANLLGFIDWDTLFREDKLLLTDKQLFLIKNKQIISYEIN